MPRASSRQFVRERARVRTCVCVCARTHTHMYVPRTRLLTSLPPPRDPLRARALSLVVTLSLSPSVPPCLPASLLPPPRATRARALSQLSEGFSEEAQDFADLCLLRDPRQRPAPGAPRVQDRVQDRV